MRGLNALNDAAGTSYTERTSTTWERAERILAGARRPRFPSRSVSVASYGASGDGGRDCTAAFRAAVADCAAAGGGRVVVPPGVFPTGPIHLLGGVELHLEAGATVRFRQEPAAYLPAVLTRWEGVELMSYSPLVYAHGQENVAITGAGTLDGGADAQHWWPWKGKPEFGWRPGAPSQAAARDLLLRLAERGVPVRDRVFGAGHHLRPMFVQPYRCRNVWIEGVTLRASPMWVIHPVLCRNVVVEGVTVDSPGPNNDGCNPESCRGVVIRRCKFDTGDDCIALKAGRDADGRRLAAPCEDVVIEDCDFRDGHGGVTIGSEMSGGVRRVFVRGCRMDGPGLDTAIRVKTNPRRGGFVEDVHVRAVTVGTAGRSAIEVDCGYEDAAGDLPPRVTGIEVDGLTVRRAARAFSLRGSAAAPIGALRLTDCRFDEVASEPEVSHVRELDLRRVLVNGRLYSPPGLR